MIYRSALMLAALIVTQIAACTSNTSDTLKETEALKEMPAVNDENCKPESIAKVDESVRQKFADACFRRGEFKPSTGKTW